MKNLLLIILLLPFFSCSEKSAENPNQNNAVADAESSVSSSLKSSRYDGNMVNDIHGELIKTDDKLKLLDEKILKVYAESRKIIDEKQKVLSKSEDFYRDANQITKSISDSLLKKQTEILIKASSEKYETKTLALKNLITKVEKGSADITDQYSVFKIRKTLPEIEKYQNQNPLESKDLERLVSQQNQLIEEIKEL